MASSMRSTRRSRSWIPSSTTGRCVYLQCVCVRARMRVRVRVTVVCVCVCVWKELPDLL